MQPNNCWIVVGEDFFHMSKPFCSFLCLHGLFTNAILSLVQSFRLIRPVWRVLAGLLDNG